MKWPTPLPLPSFWWTRVRHSPGSPSGTNNVKTQGLYLDANPVVYDPDDMFRKVSATFPVVREVAATGQAVDDGILL